MTHLDGIAHMKLAKKRFTPTGKKVVLQMFKLTETEGGITLPDNVNPLSYKTPHALVVAVGPDVKQLKRGDRVLVPAGAPCLEVKHMADRFLVMDEDLVVGVLLEEPEGD